MREDCSDYVRLCRASGSREGPKLTKMGPSRCQGGTLEAQMGQKTNKGARGKNGPRFWEGFWLHFGGHFGVIFGTFWQLFWDSILASILVSFLMVFGAIFGHFLETELV